MPIAHYKPTVTPRTLQQPTKALPDNYKGNVYDNNNEPLSGLLAYIQGAPWAVDWYRQILSEHNDVKELDDGLDAAYQTYECIKGLEIRVEQEISSSTDTVTQQTTVEGSGLIYPFIVPNRNDYFITSTSFGKQALFQVVDNERKTFQEQSVHGVKYRLVRYMLPGDTLFESLTQKTVRTLYFSRDRLVQGLSPLLTTKNYQEILDYDREYSRLVQQYFRTFFNYRAYTLVAPGQLDLIYDSFLMDFLFSITQSGDAEQLLRTKRYPVGEDIYLEQPQIWEALIKRDGSILSYCNRFMGLARVSNFDSNSFIRSAYHGVMYQIVYPRSVDSSMLSGSPSLPFSADGVVYNSTTNSTGGHMLSDTNMYSLANMAVPVYPAFDISSTYLLTPAFYDNTDNKSILEIVVWDYLNTNTLKHEYINILLKLYPLLDRLEQYYYGPILLLLLKTAVRNVY